MGECFITRRGGAVSDYTPVIPQDVPVLNTLYPDDATAIYEYGDIIGFSCNVEVLNGSPSDYSYQWYVNGDPITGATGEAYTHFAEDVGEATVYCQVSSSEGSTKSREAKLKVISLAPDTQYLYNRGDQFTSVTGGWQFGGTESEGRAYERDGELTCYAAMYNCFGRSCYTNKKIDMTSYNKIHFYFSGIECGAYAFVSENTKIPSAAEIKNNYPSAHWTGNWISPKEFVIDISNVSGSYYPIAVAGPRPYLDGGNANDQAWFFLDYVWLEK